MEELIWKYLDNECTAEEITEVENLLSSDPIFKEMYDRCAQINEVFMTQSYMPLSLDLKTKMIAEIQSQVATTKSFSVLPLPVLLGLSLVGIISIVFAILMPQQKSLINFELPIDERSITIATWSLVSFALLLLVDYTIKRVLPYRKQFFLFG